MINKIVLRRRYNVTIPEKIVTRDRDQFGFNNDNFLLAMMKNIESLGFTFDKSLFDAVRNMTQNEIKLFYKELILDLKELVGADVEYNPMYPNFPQQVREMEDIELLINAIIHYWSFGTLTPEYEKDERLPLLDNKALIVLELGTIDDMWEIFANLLGSKTSISEQDKEDVKTIIRDFPDYHKDHLPEEIPMKENVAFLCNTILTETDNPNGDAVKKYFKTATDVLRLITAMSDGDISLANKTKYKHFKRPERKFIMDLLAGCGKSVEEDMFRYQHQWIRVGEIIHPASDQFRNQKYNDVKEAFCAIRQNVKPLFFGGKVHQLIQSGRIEDASKMLQLRPGEFARQIDKLLREADHPNYVVNCFAPVAEKVATPTLLNLRQHFINRPNNTIRVVMPKGKTANAYTIPAQEKKIDDITCRNMVKICENAVIEQYRNRDYLGNVYIDEEFKNHIAPFSQRSASTATKTLTRGSRIKLDDNAKAIRGFIWWTNTEIDDWRSRVDIDLSVSFYDDDWGFKQHVGWTNLRDGALQCYHSGDITDGGDPNGKGVAEFIDFDIDKCAKHGRYAVFTIHSYTCQPFDKISNCRFGWMSREDVDSGEIFEPSTVEMSMDVNASSIIAVPVVFDCKTREIIWCDLNSQRVNTYDRGNAIECNLEGVIAACYAAVNIKKTSLYDAIMLNAKARGQIVGNRDEADIIFSNDTTKPTEIVTDEAGNIIEQEKDIPIITAYETDYYMGQIL